MPTKNTKFCSKAFLKTAPKEPGVYQMLDNEQKVLYVGKAKSLTKRLSNYFQSHVPIKTAALVKRIHQIEVIVTNSELEALLLEQNLIKQHKPPYNILLRDDKSYPFILLSGHNLYPSLSFYRGRSKRKENCFGPYPSAGSVRETLAILQKIFLLRQCKDSYFNNRTRPCLQYQIKRCKAPCMEWVSAKEYAQDIKYSTLFLQGKNQELLKQLQQAMDQAANNLEYEKAGLYRDQIQSIQKIQQSQIVNVQSGDIDAVGLTTAGNNITISVLFIRAGRLLGQRHYYTKKSLQETNQQIIESFLAQYYISKSNLRDYPKEIIIPDGEIDTQALVDAITNLARHKVKILQTVRSDRRQWQDLVQKNSQFALNRKLAENQNILQQWQSLQKILELNQLSQVECFDISHTMGEATVASCVVFNAEGPLKSAYRRYNINHITPGDDYAAMSQAVAKRFQGTKSLPDLLLIDGGAGQLSAVSQSLDKLNLLGSIKLVSVAKGPARKSGLEKLISPLGREFQLEEQGDAFLLIQRIRDEAHRFAITGHRQQRQSTRNKSTLEDIPRVGAKRRTALLRHFGGLQGVLDAPQLELQKVPGINAVLAEQIYKSLH